MRLNARALRQASAFDVLTVLLAVAVMLLVVYPLLRMLWVAVAPAGTPSLAAVSQVFGAPWLAQTVFNTVVIVGTSSVLALVFGGGIAWLNERTDARLGLIGDILPIVPLLVPSIAFAIGWVFLGAPGTGFINGALAATLGRLGIDAGVQIAGWTGVIFLYTIHSVPYVYLVVAAALRNVDSSIEEASRTSGASAWTTLWKISLPAIAPALVSGALLALITGFANYSIPVIVAERAGIGVISVRIFRMLNAEIPPRLDQAAVMTVFVLVAIAIMWSFQRRLVAGGRFSAIAGKGARWTPVRLGPWRWLAWAALFAYFMCAAVLPLGALIVVALQPFWTGSIVFGELSLINFHEVYVADQLTRAAFMSSMLYGIFGGMIAMLAASMIALFAVRHDNVFGRFVDGVMKLPAAFSHLALAVGFLLALAGPPFSLGGTVTLLLLVYVVIHLPQASITATSAVAQVGRELSEAAAVAGASDARAFRTIALPLILPGIVAGWALLFVLIAGEVTASALLSGLGRPVIGFVILSAWESGTWGNLAALAGGFAIMNVVVVLFATVIGRGNARLR
ncbi:iron ABC transporter permease [Pigmentiphaga soli]